MLALAAVLLSMLAAGTATASGDPSAASEANEPSAAELAVARELFRQAGELRDSGHCDQALVKLRQALAIKETPGLRFHVAYCEEALGQLVEALNDYDRASELIASGIAAPDVEGLLGPARDAVRRRIPTVHVQLPSASTLERAELDGKAVSSVVLRDPVPLDPGHHELLVVLSGYEPFETSFALGESQNRLVQIALTALRPSAPSRAPAPAERPRQDTSGGPLRTYALLGGSALTLAALGVGIGFSLSAASASERARSAADYLADHTNENDACVDPLPGQIAEACGDVRQAQHDEQRARAAAQVGYVAAAISAAATVSAWVLWPKPDRNTALSFAAGADAVSLSFRSRF
jgi:tetratricopeptide (TPR) repeat protein